jgi:MFS family permease
MLAGLGRRTRATFGGLPGSYWALWSGTLVNRLGGFVNPFLALYLTTARGASVEVVGSIVALVGAGTIAASLAGGILTDRIGPRRTALLGLTGSGLAMAALGFARSIPLIAPLAFLVGFLADLSRPAIGTLVAEVVPERDRLRAYGLLHWAVNIGFSVAPVVAGFMATRSYLALFLGDAATTLAMALIVKLRVPETSRRGGSAATILRGLGAVVRDRPFMLFLGLTAAVGMLYMQAGTALALDMLAHGLGPDVYGPVIAVNGLLIVVLQPSLTRIVAERPRLPVLAASALFVAAGFGLTAFASAAPFYIFTVIVWTLGEILSSPAYSAITAERAPPERRGLYQGMSMLSYGVAAFLGPGTGALVWRHLGATVLWAGCAVIGVAAAAGYMALRGSFRTSR